MKRSAVTGESIFARAARYTALLAAALLPYLNSLEADFTFDSGVVVLQDDRVHEASTDAVKRIFLEDYWSPNIRGLYRPITTLSFWFNHAVLGNGEDPTGYHVFNSVLHALNVILAWIVLTRVGWGRWAAWLAALIFAVHPLNVEAVTNLVGRSDLLATFFVLGGLLAFIQAGGAVRRCRWLALAGLCALLGVLSKESSVVILGVVFLYRLCFYERGEGWKRWKDALWNADYLWLLVPILVVWGWRLWLYWGIPIPPVSVIDNIMSDASLPIRLLTGFKIFAFYFYLLFFPRDLSVDYSYHQVSLASFPPLGPADWVALAMLLAVLFSGLYLLFRVHRHPRLFFGFFFFFGTLFPASNLLVVAASIVGERFLYLPMIGFWAVVVLGISRLGAFLSKNQSRKIWQTVLWASVVIGVLALGWRTHERNKDWENNITLFRGAVEVSPNCARVHSALANSLFGQADDEGVDAVLDEVIDLSERAVSILDTLPPEKRGFKTYLDLTGYHLKRIEIRGAEAAAESARRAREILDFLVSRMESKQPEIRANYAIMATRHALPSYHINGSILQRLAEYHSLMEEWDMSAAALERAVAYRPGFQPLYRLQAEVLCELGRYPGAALALTKSIIIGNPQTLPQDWPLMREIFQSMGSPVSPTVTDGVRTGLDPRQPEVQKLLKQASLEIYEGLKVLGSHRSAQGFIHSARRQFGPDIIPENLEAPGASPLPPAPDPR